MVKIIILIAVVFVSIFFGARMYFIDSKNTLNRITCTSFLLTGLYAITEFSLCIVDDLEIATNIGWIHSIIVIPILLCYFISTKIYSEKSKAFPKWHKNIALPPLFIAFIIISCCQTQFTYSFSPPPFLHEGEWKYIFNKESFSYKVFLFICIYGTSLSIFNFYHGYIYEKNEKVKKTRLILLLVFIFAPSGIIFSFLLGISEIETGQYFVSPFMFICILSLAYIFSNYQLLQASPYKAFDNILSSITNQVFILDNELELKYMNNAASRLFDISPNERGYVEYKNTIDFREKIQYSHSDWNQLIQGLKQLNAKDQLQQNVDLDFPDSKRNLLVNFSPIFKKGKKLGYAAIASDISKLRQYEKQLTNFTTELQEKNQELERFAYIASHDLKSPLRNIVSFLGLIERRVKQKDEAELLEFVSFASSSAKQMFQLVEDVLEFSKLTKNSDPNILALNGESVIKQAIINLNYIVQDRKATISYDEHIPTIHADKAQLLQLFQNLIENGIKYNSKETPTIHIAYEASNTHDHFHIIDNGIGINQEYFDTIFDMFKRLHTNQSYDGTGIGLAICKKIVQLHDGEISLQSIPDKGSTFSFSLKKHKTSSAQIAKLQLHEI